MTEAIDNYHFTRLLKLIYNHNGLDCSHYKTSYLKRRVAVRMRATKSISYKEYERLLATDKDEYDLLLDRLTINVSHFFRDLKVYEEIKKIIIPKLKMRKQVRIWSAGCANGEEPYSLAMLFDLAWPGINNWQIIASDLDPNCLLRAKEGRYRPQAIVEMPIEYKKRYLEEAGESWIVKPSIKKRVTFKQLDLTRTLPRETYDMILCRNVLIYFLPELQTRLFEGFRKLLMPDGFLVLGKTETLLGEWRQRFQALNGPERLFQVKGEQPQAGETKIG